MTGFMRLASVWVMRSLGFVFLMLYVAAVATGCGDEAGPHIDEVMPNAAARGTDVDIIGARFCGDGDAAEEDGSCKQPPAGSVSFGASVDVVRATVVGWTNDRITVTVPSAAAEGATLVVVTLNGTSSNAAEFEVQ